MRHWLVITTLALTLGGPAQAEDAAAPGEGATLVLSPRASKQARGAVDAFTRGLARAGERFGASSVLVDADLAALTPGDLVARCPARISASCLAQAAQKTGAQRTLTGVLERRGAGYLVQLKVVDAASAEIFAVRDVRLYPAQGDELDMQMAGQCLGLDALWSSAGREGALEESPCDDRVHVTSARDRAHYEEEAETGSEALWLTVVPDADARRAYLEKNGVLAGGFASAVAVAVVGVATATLLGVQTALTHGEALELASDNPQAFSVAGSQITVDNEFDPTVARYRSLESRGRLESFASLGAGFAALLSGVTAAALYSSADVPGRYDAYMYPAETVEDPAPESAAEPVAAP